MRAEKLRKVIKELLLNSEWNRNSDYALYADYIKTMLPNEESTNYYNIMINYKHFGIFSFKAVERTRRKIQAEAYENGQEELLSSKQVKRYRDELQKVYMAEFEEIG